MSRDESSEDDEDDDSSSSDDDEEDEPDWLKEELIASKTRARWGESGASVVSKALIDQAKEDEIVEEIDGQSSQI